jgi:kumamolisin
VSPRVELPGLGHCAPDAEATGDQRPLTRAGPWYRGSPADGQGIRPADLARLYGIAPNPKAEPCVAVIALGGGYSLDDLKKAAGDNGNQLIVDDRTVSGFGNLPGFDLTADVELALDLQVLLGLLPRARVLVYFAVNNEDGMTSALGQAVSDNEASVVSISWGSAESLWPVALRRTAESALATPPKRRSRW